MVAEKTRRFVFAIEHKLGFLFPGKDSPLFDLFIRAAEWWLSPIFFQVLILLREFWRHNNILRFQMGKFCCFPSSSEVLFFFFNFEIDLIVCPFFLGLMCVFKCFCNVCSVIKCKVMSFSFLGLVNLKGCGRTIIISIW